MAWLAGFRNWTELCSTIMGRKIQMVLVPAFLFLWREMATHLNWGHFQRPFLTLQIAIVLLHFVEMQFLSFFFGGGGALGACFIASGPGVLFLVDGRKTESYFR